jgi:hypothetical protein
MTRRILWSVVHAVKLFSLVRSLPYLNMYVFNLAQLPSSHSLQTDTSNRYAGLHHLDMQLVVVSTTLQYAKGAKWRQNNTHCIASSSLKTMIDHSKHGHSILLLLRNSSQTTEGMNRTDWKVCVDNAVYHAKPKNNCQRHCLQETKSWAEFPNFPLLISVAGTFSQSLSFCGLFYNADSM